MDYLSQLEVRGLKKNSLVVFKTDLQRSTVWFQSVDLSVPLRKSLLATLCSANRGILIRILQSRNIFVTFPKTNTNNTTPLSNNAINFPPISETPKTSNCQWNFMWRQGNKWTAGTSHFSIYRAMGLHQAGLSFMIQFNQSTKSVGSGKIF